MKAGLGSLPAKPNAPARGEEGNSGTSISLTWGILLSETLEVNAYNLYMDDGQGVSFSLLYTGTCSEVTIDTGILPGVLYTFYVTATNFNGEGERSDLI